jgi:hypothetical protein
VAVPGAALLLAGAMLAAPLAATPVSAQGVGGATWTPSRSETVALASRFLLDGDAIAYRTDATWDREQVRGLSAYLDSGLHYTHEVNDRSGRLSATGYWATNHPDPAYDRDDDDGDRRWEEAEITAGRLPPRAGVTYTTVLQFSRWHAKRVKRACEWSWDRRLGGVEVLSQLSRELLGEWQAERYTLAYETLDYPRVEASPALTGPTAPARCRDADPGVNQGGYVVTFARPLPWGDLASLVSVGSAKWTAFEAVGSAAGDRLTWTCGGPYDDVLRLSPCAELGVKVDGVTAAVGYLDEHAAGQLRAHPDVAAIDGLRDTLTGLLYDVGGFGVERPGLTVDDRYWELFLAE